MSAQLDLQFVRPEPGQIEEFRRLLSRYGWLTRRQVCEHTGWPERTVRAVAEQMGAEVVRGQKGFKLAADIERDELGVVQQASDAAISQGKRMIRYGIALRNMLHARVG